MLKSNLLLIAIVFFMCDLFAQDSAWIKLRPKYNKVSGLHRIFFGENYRREWSDSVKLPLINISQVAGGLKPIKLGGGHQTISLRLASSKGDEWVIRSIEKDASILLPPALRKTFARDVIDDAMSAQHPFSPLVVAELARAANVPHANPVIGIVQKDPLLGDYNDLFGGKVVLIEEREPFGNSDNSAEMRMNIKADNDNSIDNKAFLRAVLLDVLIGDWDRHADQWRWVDVKKGKTKTYVGVPRDRDQAFYVNQGIFPWIASLPWVVPNLKGFKGKIEGVKYSLLASSFITPQVASQLSHNEWMDITNEFVRSITDNEIDKALKKLPADVYHLRHENLSKALKQRRKNLPAAMEKYYRFANRIVDIELSDKHELVNISDSASNTVIDVRKKTKTGISDQLMTASYDPSITKEIRLYTGRGDDSIVVNKNSSPINIRLIGQGGNKHFNIVGSDRKLKVYSNATGTSFSGNEGKLYKKLSDDTSNLAYVPTNRYNILKPLIGFGFNVDDGFLLGLGFNYMHHGFRKVPYASVNRLMLYYSFATSAFRLKYAGEWLKAIRNTDFLLNVDAYAPENTQNFFGRGNESEFNKTGDHKKYYRARFNLYQVTPALRWRTQKSNTMFSAGPSLQHYRFDSIDNKGRFINNGAFINSYDSVSIKQPKTHGGVVMNFTVDKRNSLIIPTEGIFFNVRLQGFAGMNNQSKSFGQLIPQLSVYKKLNAKGTIILADRLGGGITVGKSAFYQSLFAGGHDNLLGYRQYRFAGENLLYNNLELRLKVADFAGYIIPGQFGLLGFYDVGRVWVKDENSTVWHSGTGGGVYFAPAQMVVLNVLAGYSKEGWYPYITLGFRF